MFWAGQQRDARSMSRCSSRSDRDRAPLYMNTNTSQHPTYQNHFFETGPSSDWHDRQNGPSDWHDRQSGPLDWHDRQSGPSDWHDRHIGPSEWQDREWWGGEQQWPRHHGGGGGDQQVYQHWRHQGHGGHGGGYSSSRVSTIQISCLICGSWNVIVINCVHAWVPVACCCHTHHVNSIICHCLDTFTSVYQSWPSN